MAASGDVRLFHAKTSSASWRVRIALGLKRVPYVSVLVDLARQEQLSDAYRRVNPVAQVPCLEIDGLRLAQSVAIIEYLDETRHDPPLLPPTAAGRAVARQVVELINSGIQPLHNRAVMGRLGTQLGADPEAQREWARYWLERRLGQLETVLAPLAGRYALGDAVSMADVFLYPQVGKARDFGVRVDHLPTIARVLAALEDQEIFVASSPEALPAS
jgi:maleylacetoacetate isomerase